VFVFLLTISSYVSLFLTVHSCIVVDRHHIDADPDPEPNFYFVADPDPDADTNPTSNFTHVGKPEFFYFYS
jgi:hypothetical protein